ncbi:MAG: DUF1730 domain-containing protein, partial [Nanoarchaeota archaeon]|nr:DUF1730 domain-containing protein [Nanoarchaeota archaeon]
MTNGLQLSKIIKEYAYKEGFHLVAITSADPLNDFQYYREWLDQGYGADMEYLKRHAAQKENPKHIFPEVQSIICCALSYKTDIQNPIHAESDEGIISNYAWGDDYHEIMWQKLENVLEKMKTFIPEL